MRGNSICINYLSVFFLLVIALSSCKKDASIGFDAITGTYTIAAFEHNYAVNSTIEYNDSTVVNTNSYRINSFDGVHYSYENYNHSVGFNLDSSTTHIQFSGNSAGEFVLRTDGQYHFFLNSSVDQYSYSFMDADTSFQNDNGPITQHNDENSGLWHLVPLGDQTGIQFTGGAYSGIYSIDLSDGQLQLNQVNTVTVESINRITVTTTSTNFQLIAQ